MILRVELYNVISELVYSYLPLLKNWYERLIIIACTIFTGDVHYEGPEHSPVLSASPYGYRSDLPAM